jgi:hypothetical protein
MVVTGGVLVMLAGSGGPYAGNSQHSQAFVVGES